MQWYWWVLIIYVGVGIILNFIVFFNSLGTTRATTIREVILVATVGPFVMFLVGIALLLHCLGIIRIEQYPII